VNGGGGGGRFSTFIFQRKKSTADVLDVANDRVRYRGGYTHMPTHEAVYMVIMETFFPDENVVSGFS
jgi:hypothetical protein